MDLKKAREHYVSSLSFKKRVLSGFGVGLLASILLCLFFNFNSNTSSSSALSWFLTIPNAIGTHSNNLNSSTNLSTDLGKTHVLNLTASENNPSKRDFVNNSIIVVNNSSSLVHQESIFNTTHVRGEQIMVGNNSTIVVNNSSSLVHQESIFKKTHVRGEQIIVENNVPSEKSSRNDVTQIVKVNAKSVANDTLMHGNAIGKFDKTCDVFDGKWVRDERHGLYPGGSCPYIDNDFNCYKNGRPDEDFLRWRWQPNGCNIPRMNATDFLARLRNKRLLFVGDSLNRNMWESLVCILRHSIKRKENVYEFHGKHEFKTRGYYSFRFKDYNCSVDFVQSPYLVREIIGKNSNGSTDERLRLDLLDATTAAYRTADVIVFNTGHWWTHEKTSRGTDYYQEGNHVYPMLKVMEAYRKALATWAKWVDQNIDSRKTEVIFRGYSLTHYKGRQWNSGGQCHKETEPIYEEKYLGKYPSKMRTLEQMLKNMKTPVMYLNISKLTDYRKDGHPAIYRKTYKSIKEQISSEASQDCSHWCLPGIPDTWNELLYVLLLQNGKGSWKQ